MLEARAIRKALKVFKTSYSCLSVESDSSVAIRYLTDKGGI